MEHAALKDPGLREYYDALFLMYGGLGWKKLQEDVALMRAQHDRLAGVETSEQLWFRKGQVEMMEWILTHQQTVEATYASLLADQEAKPEYEPTVIGERAKVVE